MPSTIFTFSCIAAIKVIYNLLVLPVTHQNLQPAFPALQAKWKINEKTTLIHLSPFPSLPAFSPENLFTGSNSFNTLDRHGKYKPEGQKIRKHKLPVIQMQDIKTIKYQWILFPPRNSQYNLILFLEKSTEGNDKDE